MNLPAILAQLTALELAIDMRRIDRDRHANAAYAAHNRGEVPTAEQMGAWWWSYYEGRLLPIARWATVGGEA